ncbi:DUF4190 domain-containing protein [Aeromicrobium sp. Leaf350]|uniref:DUF4190 domain-containing protein n=1 Tax=Aeromicrobium sp. Leaf350 TaxID=2876565 RepID=UPI001E50E00B|nr:DUF4190 domain-containing protein [Aeromicrobium sp. Leaf350]
MSTHEPDQPEQPEQPAPPNPYAQPDQHAQPPQQPYPPQGYYPPQAYGYQQPMYPYYVQRTTSQKAIWAMVLGIVSIFGTACFYIGGFAMGIPAIVLGVIARKEIAASNGQQEGGGFAVAGLVTGIVGLVLNLLIVGFLILVFATEGFGDPSWDY